MTPVLDEVDDLDPKTGHPAPLSTISDLESRPGVTGLLEHQLPRGIGVVVHDDPSQPHPPKTLAPAAIIAGVTLASISGAPQRSLPRPTGTAAL